MDQDTFLKISGWAIAAVSLIVNILQLRKNNELKRKTTTTSQTLGTNSRANQQVSTGAGSNYASGRDTNIGK
jgi:hypothetical protein